MDESEYQTYQMLIEHLNVLLEPIGLLISSFPGGLPDPLLTRPMINTKIIYEPFQEPVGFIVELIKSPLPRIHNIYYELLPLRIRVNNIHMCNTEIRLFILNFVSRVFVSPSQFTTHYLIN